MRLWRGISTNIILLGLVSFLTDTSSEMIMPLFPMFISALGGGGVVIGLIGGLGESISSLLKILAGYWSDRSGRRLIFVFSGYTLSALAKLLFPVATSWSYLLVLKPSLYP